MRALLYIIEAISGLYLMILLVRLLLPFVHANFRNPLAQAVFRLTSPPVVPLRRVLPPLGRVDTATLVVAYAIQYLVVLVIFLLSGFEVLPHLIAWTAFIKLIVLFIQMLAYLVIIRIILGWIAPTQYNPVTELIGALTEPLLAPVRRVIPPLGGLDISPIFVTIGLFATAILVEDLSALVF